MEDILKAVNREVFSHDKDPDGSIDDGVDKNVDDDGDFMCK